MAEKVKKIISQEELVKNQKGGLKEDWLKKYNAREVKSKT